MSDKKHLAGAVLLITHTRVLQLTKVIQSLAEAWIEPYRELHVILHHNQNQVKEVVESIKFIQPKILLVNRDDALGPQEAISRNVFDGLSRAFLNTKIDFVTVLEDDIVVRNDFLDFNASVMEIEIHDKKFKGINGFSGARFDSSKDDLYSRFRYGFGWGWTIHRSYWEEVRKIWENDFQTHWDALLEPNVRRGYVVMPHNSRILNLGFDSSATHTHNGGNQKQALEASFYSNSKIFSKKPFNYSSFQLNWRRDVFEFLTTNKMHGKVIHFLFWINSKIHISSKSNLFEKFVKAKVRGLMFRVIGHLSNSGR